MAVLFVALAVPLDEVVADSFGLLTGWVTRNLGWFYILAVSSLLVFLLGLAVSRYGNIRLGADDSRPDYSNPTWFTMLFSQVIWRSNVRVQQAPCKHLMRLFQRFRLDAAGSWTAGGAGWLTGEPTPGSIDHGELLPDAA